MALSKRLRYEILRRDNHTCRYCGATAPDVKLTVDHVTPVALGGTDEPANLVTACSACNNGKTSTNPDAPIVADVAEDAIRWARAREVAARQLRQESGNQALNVNRVLEYWSDAFSAQYGRIPHVPEGAELSVRFWLSRGLNVDDMFDFIENAVVPRAHRIRWAQLWNYFAGCCWGRLRKIEDNAQAIVGGAEADSFNVGGRVETDIGEDFQAGMADMARQLLGTMILPEAIELAVQVERGRLDSDEGDQASDDEVYIQAAFTIARQLLSDRARLQAAVESLLGLQSEDLVKSCKERARAEIADRDWSRIRYDVILAETVRILISEVEN